MRSDAPNKRTLPFRDNVVLPPRLKSVALADTQISYKGMWRTYNARITGTEQVRNLKNCSSASEEAICARNAAESHTALWDTTDRATQANVCKLKPRIYSTKRNLHVGNKKMAIPPARVVLYAFRALK
jgi:hypothetical protein